MSLVVIRSICATLFVCFAGCAGAADFTGRVVGVADGDTITVLAPQNIQHKVRLSGIDAPEKSQAFGQRAKQSLSDLVFNRQVTVQTHKKDRYRREIGKVLVDGLDANLEQIKRGMARHYKAYQREQSAEDRAAYAAAEDEARRLRVGLWQEAQPVPPWELRKDGHQNLQAKR